MSEGALWNTAHFHMSMQCTEPLPFCSQADCLTLSQEILLITEIILVWVFLFFVFVGFLVLGFFSQVRHLYFGIQLENIPGVLLVGTHFPPFSCCLKCKWEETAVCHMELSEEQDIPAYLCSRLLIIRHPTG